MNHLSQTCDISYEDRSHTYPYIKNYYVHKSTITNKAMMWNSLVISDKYNVDRNCTYVTRYSQKGNKNNNNSHGIVVLEIFSVGK